jgi:hypothetical protein
VTITAGISRVAFPMIGPLAQLRGLDWKTGVGTLGAGKSH